jgi:hypothetical protein
MTDGFLPAVSQQIWFARLTGSSDGSTFMIAGPVPSRDDCYPEATSGQA